jgi:hypothetical protein
VDGRYPLFRSEADRLGGISVIIRHGGPWLVVFGMADDHGHLVVLCSRRRAGKIAWAISRGMSAVTGRGLEPTDIRPVNDRTHMETMVRYCIDQPVKHKLPDHPALWSGSCFADLVGARVLGGLSLRILEALPRFRAAAAWKIAGFVEAAPEPLDDRCIVEQGLGALIEAAAFAAGAPPDLRGRAAAVIRARAAVVWLGRTVGFRPREMATGLGVTREAVRKLGQRTVDDHLLAAVRLRMALQVALDPAPCPDANQRRR